MTADGTTPTAAQPGAHEPTDERCRAMTRGGRRCRNPAVYGQRHCAVHLGQGAEVAGEVRRCQGHTKTGERCKIPPVHDSEYCGFHRAQTLAGAVADGGAADAMPRSADGNDRDLVADAARQLEGLIRELDALARRDAPSTRVAALVSYAGRAFSALTRGEPGGRWTQSVLEALRPLGRYLARARAGATPIDATGADVEAQALARPFLAWMCRAWWRVRVTGLEHVPAQGPVLLVGNRAGLLPWDGLVVAATLDFAAPDAPPARVMFDPALVRTPILATVLARLGHLPDVRGNAARLLANGARVVGFPEGERGAGRTRGERWSVLPLDVELFEDACAASVTVPVIPVAIAGAWESAPTLARLDSWGGLLELPFLPLTPTFPWLGPLGLVPYPVTWTVDFGPPVVPDGPSDAEPRATAQRLRDAVASDLAGRLAAMRAPGNGG